MKVWTGSVYQETVEYPMLRTPEMIWLGKNFEDRYFEDYICLEPYLLGRWLLYYYSSDSFYY